MYEYGNLLFDKIDGWTFIKKDSERVDIETEKFIDALNELGEDGWELIHFEDEIGYVLKREK